MLKSLPVVLTVLFSLALSADPIFAQTCNVGGNVISCLEVRNDLATARTDEVAYSGVAIPAAANLLDTNQIEVADLAGTAVPAQFRVLARWGGTVDNPARPIRWLEVAIQDNVAANTTNEYQLRRNVTPAPVLTPLTVTDLGNGDYSIATGAATFRVDSTNPALLESVVLGATTVYTHTAGAGPVLEIGGNVLDTTTGAVQVDANSFVVLEEGPLKASVAVQGHFIDAGFDNDETLCNDFGGLADYQAMGFTAVLTFTRGTGHVDFNVEIRNECLDAQFGPFPGGERTFQRASWELPVSVGTATRFYGASGALTTATGNVVVEQRKGAGNPWARRARVLDNGVEVVTATTVDRPFVSVSGTTGAVTAQMPWMRFREPQALAATGSTLSLRFVSEPLQVGGAKGLWNMARVSFSAPVAGPANLETDRAEAEAFLERGLLVLNRRDTLNDAAIFPTLGTDATSLVKTDYVNHMNLFHDDTVGPGGQHELAKTYGSQLWPDTQGNSWAMANNAVGPTNNAGGQNYWNTSQAELLELLRSGDPKWAWDFALPLTWQQLISAYVNKGENADNFKNGFALNSPTCAGAGGQCDEGQWYRYAQGSDDYTYTSGQIAYTVRPSYLLQRRFAQAGASVIGRYNVPRAQQATRGVNVNQVDLTRQVIQHFVLLANCAEMVPGAEGQACHDQLVALVTELSEENMSSGLMCQSDIQPANPSLCSNGGPGNWCDCVEPQRFIMNSLIAPFFLRILNNYGDLGGNIEDGLTMSYWHLYRAGLGIVGGPSVPSDPQRPAIPQTADWLSQPGWDWDVTPYVVQDVDVTDGDPNTTDGSGDPANFILEPNNPHTTAWFMIADSLDPALELCDVSRAVLDSQFFLDAWDAYDNLGGWLKAPAQIMQGMVFGVGLYDTCAGGAPGNNTPQVTITAPADPTTVDSGVEVTFNATATDTEDGDLAASVNWTSDLDGFLGTGATVMTTLSDGVHTVTASATDSGALTGTDTVTVSVNAEPPPPPPPTGLVLNENFDNGAAGWTLGGLWHLATAASGCTPVSASGTTSAYFGIDTDCNFDTGSQEVGDLTSPQITGITVDSTLSFNYRREVEFEPSATVDFTQVDIRVVGGAWTTIWTRNSQDASANAWTASGDIALDDGLAGETIEVRFRFDSDDEQFNDFLGWMIDDVQVTGAVAAGGCSEEVLCDGFESGDTSAWSVTVGGS